MPVIKKDYETQIIRFLNKGIDLSRPPELVDIEHYSRFSGMINNQDGSLQPMPGADLMISGLGGAIHSFRRLSRYSDGTSIFIFGFSTQIQFATASTPPGVAGVSDTGFSGKPLTFVPYRVALTAAPHLYVGDSAKNVKIDVAGTSTKMGLMRSATAITYAASGAGALDGDYDWRQTPYNHLTGAEGNPTDVGLTLTLANQQADVSVVAYGASAGDVTRIRLYRRGGTLTDNWYLVTTLTNTTATYTDNNTDSSISSAATLELDNDVPVTSVSLAGVTLTDSTAVPLPYLWGPVDDTLFGTGDPNQPDMVYFSKKLKPEAWPAANKVSVDPNDKPMNGFAYDRQSFVFTRHNLYTLVPNMVGSSQTWTREKTPCGKGIVGPRAFCVGERIWFCYEDGIYETDGSREAVRISDPIRPLFPYHSAAGYTANSSYTPIEFGAGIGDVTTITMAYHNGEVYLYFTDRDGDRQSWAYTVETKAWRFLTPEAAINFGYSDEAPASAFYMGLTNGDLVLQSSGDFAGTAIPCVFETGGHDQGLPRADKEYGDAALWMDCSGGTVTCRAYINSDYSAAAATQSFTGSGLQRYVMPINAYGRHISFFFDFEATDTMQPKFHWIELSWLPHVEEIVSRKTDWDDLGHPADKLVKGLVLMADTRGQSITIDALYDGGTVGATFTIGPHAAGSPRVYHVGFPSFRGREVRLAPRISNDITNQEPLWKFYGVLRWLFDPEPETLGWHEVYWSDAGYPHDKLVKGVTIEADAGGTARTLQVLDDDGTVAATITIPAGTSGIPAISEHSWASFRTRNIRIVETAPATPWKLFRIVNWTFDPEPMDLVHWETQESSHGFYGFHFERDAYVELRSSVTTALTVEIDGVAGTAYSIASTGGARQRVYVPFRSNKGKLYRYKLDASDAIHVYDFSVRVKDWRELDYAQVKPNPAGTGA